MASYKRAASPHVLQDLPMSGLVLVGDKVTTTQTEMTDNYGSYNYDNHHTEYRTDSHSPAYTVPHIYPSIYDTFQPPVENSGEGKGGFFSPPSRPTSAVARPHSVTFARPMSATMKRPPSKSSNRPPSRSIMRQTPGLDGKRMLDQELLDSYIDPEYEPVSEVLSRLDEYTQNYAQNEPLTYTECECTKRGSKAFTRRKSDVEKRDSESSSGSDDEDSWIGIDVLLKTFHQYEERGHSANRQKAMMTLVETYISQQLLSEEHLEQILHFLKNSVPPVQDASLVLLRTIVRQQDNLKKVLDSQVLEFLYKCLIPPQMTSLARSALLLFEQIFTFPDHKGYWMEMAVSKLYPKLLSMLRGAQSALDVKYSACCVFRALAKYEEFISPVTEHILPTVILMRNTSAKFKEVYVEILTSLLSHTDCVPPDLIDSSAIPVTVSIISEGPCGAQYSALHLLTCLSSNDGVSSLMINTNSMVPMVLCCMKDSHCRRVRLKATEVMKILCTSHKIGLCKDLMMQLGGYLVPYADQESLISLSEITAPVRGKAVATKQRYTGDRIMWMGLEKFIDIVRNTIFREANVETDELGLVSNIHMGTVTEMSAGQLEILTHCYKILQFMCLWPLDKSRLGFSANKIDLTSFAADEKQRLHLSKVNRGLTQAIWDKVGLALTKLLAIYADKISKVCKDLDTGEQPPKLCEILELTEVDLVTSLLELTLCSALCTCECFPPLTSEKETRSSKKGSKSQQKLKSSSSPNMLSEKSCHVEAQLKSQSDSGKVFSGEDGKYLVKENSYSSNSRVPSGHASDMEQSKQELQRKEACTDRRLLRKCLFETGVFQSICPFLKCSEPEIKVLVLQILRCLVQPLQERVVPKLIYAESGPPGHRNRVRPQTAGAVQDPNKRLNQALYKMSPDLANLIKEALSPPYEGNPTQQNTTSTAKKHEIDVPKNPEDLSSIKERLQDFTEKGSLEAEQDMLEKMQSKSRLPVLDRCQPIALQCREVLITEIQRNIVTGLFSKALTVRKHFVLLLHDLVNYGESEILMKLSIFGCMPKMIDFLRVNEDNELLEIIGLTIVRLLVCKDVRLKQLFNRHGGHQLLLSMAQYTRGLLKQEVTTTLKAVSKVNTSAKKRPVSAPVSRQHAQQKAPDIWDHIQSRWNQEDKVKHVLRQWIETDYKKH